MTFPPNFQHISIDEIKSLSEDEANILLYICNIWAPITPFISTPEEPYPVSLNIIRYARKESILDRVIQAEPTIKDGARSIYESLRNKLSIPVVKKVEETTVSGSIDTSITGSV